MFGWVCLWITLGAIGIFVLILIPHNLRIWRARRSFLTLPESIRDDVLKLIAPAAGQKEIVRTLLAPDKASPVICEEVTFDSHFGGVPYAEESEVWPMLEEGSEERAPFLGQFVLTHPPLGDVWRGRLITVYLRYELEITARSYPSATADKYRKLADGPPALACQPLRHLDLPCLPDKLFESTPGLVELLRPYASGRAARGLLAQILLPGSYSADIQDVSVCYQGREPDLIQLPHEAMCPTCAAPMRFLMQFGDVVPGIQLGDAAVVYIYGCDAHPQNVRAFIDSH